MPSKYMTHEMPGCVVRWQNQNQQGSYEMRTIIPSREIEKMDYTDKGANVDLHEMIHSDEPWELNPESVDTTRELTSCESRGYCMGNWPQLPLKTLY